MRPHVFHGRARPKIESWGMHQPEENSRQDQGGPGTTQQRGEPLLQKGSKEELLHNARFDGQKDETLWHGERQHCGSNVRVDHVAQAAPKKRL